MNWDRGQLLKRETGRKCPLRYEGEPVSWDAISKWLSDEEGCHVPIVTLRYAFNKTLDELKHRLTEYPEVRDWMEEHGIPPLKPGTGPRLLDGGRYCKEPTRKKGS